MNRWRNLPVILLAAAATLSGHAEDNLPGRLFFTSEHRAALDRQRRAGLPQQRLDGTVMTLNGIVTRCGNQSSVWINGRAQHGKSTDGAVTASVFAVVPDRAVLATAAEAPVVLRVGEFIDRNTRETSDLVAPGAIRIGNAQRPAR